MPIDLANLSRVFRGIAGDFDWLPQHCRIPPEKQRQHYEHQRKPNRQPDQRAAEGFFGAASIAQRAQQERKKQAYQAVAEIECNTLERKYPCLPFRLDQRVQIIREDKPDGDHGRPKRKAEYHAPPSPAQRQSRKGRQGNDRQPDQVPCWRAPLHHRSRDRRDNEAERSKSRPDQTATGCRQIDQPEVRAGKRQEQSDHRVEQHACKNHEKCDRRACNPRSRGHHPLDRGFLRRLRSVICYRGAPRRFPVWLPHTEGDEERERGCDEVEINWKPQRSALRESAGVPERARDRVHKPGIINRAADEHGRNHANRLVAGDLVEYLRPFRGSSALGEGIKHERFVSAACQALRDPAEQSVRQAKEKEQSPAAGRRYAKSRHFYQHSDRGRDDERPTSDPIRECASWQVRANDGYRPRKIQQGILRRAEAEVEEEHRQDWVIEPRAKEHTEKDNAPPVAIGGIAGIGSTHASRAILSAFASVAIAYRNSLFAVTVVVLAALLPFAGVAYSQEPTHVPTPARTRLVVGLTQSPPFCMRGEDGSWSGISVELWQGIAADLGIDTEFRETTVTGLFDDLAPGRPLDVSIGALTITAEREDRLDFTQPFFLSGLGVALKTAPGASGLWSWLGRVLAWNFWRIVAALFVSLVLVALLIWALEHKGNPKEFGGDGKAHRGIGSALWWSAVTMTTVGYGDLAPRSPAGRLVAITWMFVSLFLVSWFTASMASILTAERLDTGSGGFVVRGPDDLRRLHVAVIASTSSEDYLRQRRIDYIRVPLKDLLEALLTGRAQAVLSDAPYLRYVARSEPFAGKITVLPQTLQTEPYGIALRDGSPWRKPVDRALLHRIAAPPWRDLIYHYLGSAE
jgi:polar amino acid transport system substrate-binding protein